MADVERYMGEDGKYAWRVKKQVESSVKEVDESELTKEEREEVDAVLEPEESKPKKKRKKK